MRAIFFSVTTQLPSEDAEIEMEPVTSVINVAATPVAAPAAPAAVAAAPAVDGVFVNLAPKMDLPPTYANDPLPTYGEAVVDVAPLQGYSGAIVLTPTAALHEVQVGGLPVGSVGTFVVSLVVAWFFGVVGYLCAVILSSTHAGRNGARAGLGLQFVQLGFYLRTLSMHALEMANSTNDEDNSDDHDHDGAGGEGSDASSVMIGSPVPLWVGYLVMVVGWLLFVHGCSVFHHVRRIVRERQLTVLAA